MEFWNTRQINKAIKDNLLGDPDKKVVFAKIEPKAAKPFVIRAKKAKMIKDELFISHLENGIEKWELAMFGDVYTAKL